MKKHLAVLLMFTVTTITFFSSCSSSKKEDPTPVINAPVGKLDVKIDGVAFEAPGAAQVTANEIILGGTLNDKAISIIITKSSAVGTYDAKGAALGVTPDVQVNYIVNLQSVYSSSYGANGVSVGTVVITEVDATNKTISGTFTSTVTLANSATTVSLTEGSFNKIPYTAQAINTLTAKVAGVDFTAGIAIGQSSFGSLIINGQTVNGGQILSLTANSDITVGSYDIGDVFSTINASYTTIVGSTPSFYTSTSGTLTITKHDTLLKRIEGTFSFASVSLLDESDGPAITEGKFGISY